MKILEKIKLKEILIFLCVISLFYLSSYLQLIPLKFLNWDIKNISTSQAIILMTFSNLCLTIIYIIFYYNSLKKDLKTFFNNLMLNLNTALIYWIVGIILMFVCNLIISLINGGNIAGNEQSVRNMISVIPSLMLVNAGILAPFNEEIIFRKSLGDIFNNKWLFVFFSFLLFGGAHVIGNIKSIIDILYIVPYGLLGASFALAYKKTDTIFTSFTMHMVHNTLAVVLLILVGAV